MCKRLEVRSSDPKNMQDIDISFFASLDEQLEQPGHLLSTTLLLAIHGSWIMRSNASNVVKETRFESSVEKHEESKEDARTKMLTMNVIPQNYTHACFYGEGSRKRITPRTCNIRRYE